MSRIVFIGLSVALSVFGCATDDSSVASTPIQPDRSVRDAGGAPIGTCAVDTDCPIGQQCIIGQCQMPTIESDCQQDSDCPGGTICDGGRCQPPGQTCNNNSDCAMGEQCRAGVCEPGPCQQDADCGSGGRCQDGICVPEDPQCREAADCPPGSICDNGFCVMVDRCSMNSDCPAGQICENEVCTNNASGCRDDAECGPNADCIDGRCVPNGPCADCPENTRCVNDMCVPIERCVGDEDCPDGQRCVAGVCEIAGGQQCVDDSQCLIGFFCSNGTCMLSMDLGMPCVNDTDCRGNFLVCLAGLCLPSIPDDGCQADADCPDGFECDATVCVERSGQLGDQCAGDFDCIDGLACLDGVCGRPNQDRCNGDAQCDAREVCVGGQCVPNPAVDCVDDLDCGGDRCIDGECVVACLDDMDCLFEQVCRDGGCVAGERPMQPSGCDNANVIRLGDTERGQTREAASTLDGTCDSVRGSGPEVVFQYRALIDGPVCATTAGSDYDTVLYVRDAECPNAERELACNDDDRLGIADSPDSTIQFVTAAAESYYLVVDGYDSDEFGQFSLELREGPCDGAPCNADRAINLGDTLVGQLVGASEQQGTCGGDGPELIYSFSTARDGPVCVSTAESAIDTVLYIRRQTCGWGQQVGCDDDDGPGNTSQLSFEPDSNVEYFIFVDAYDGGGAISISVQPGECP